MKKELQGDILSYDESKIIKAVAIIFMVYHHFFGFPDRILVDGGYLSWNVFGIYPVELIARQLKICVAMFAFISGYGIAIKLDRLETKKDINSVLRTVIDLLITYWSITIIVGILMSETESIIKNLLLIKFDLIHSAWYIKFYLEILILSVFFSLLKNRNLYTEFLIGIVVLVGSVLIGDTGFTGYYPVVYMGYVAARYKWFSYCLKKANVFIDIIWLGTALIIRHFIEDYISPFTLSFFVIIPLILLLVHLIRAFCDEKLRNLLVGGAKYSTYYWLFHAIFHGFNGKELFLQKIAYAPKLSILITIWVFILMTPMAVLCDRLKSAAKTRMGNWRK